MESGRPEKMMRWADFYRDLVSRGFSRLSERVARTEIGQVLAHPVASNQPPADTVRFEMDVPDINLSVKHPVRPTDGEMQ